MRVGFSEKKLGKRRGGCVGDSVEMEGLVVDGAGFRSLRSGFRKKMVSWGADEGKR